MIGMKHAGIYVKDMKAMVSFYQNTFCPYVISMESADEGKWLDCLSGAANTKIKISKLITERGKNTGYGDMIELVQVIEGGDKEEENIHFAMTRQGVCHIAFGVDNIHSCVDKILKNGGKIVVEPFVRENGNWLCFAQDPEGNWLELIENGVKS